MIRRILFLTCVVSAFAFASSESKDLAFRADKAVQAGKFAKANGLYERALLSSRKESDILSESRILISMATLRTQSLDLKFASDLLLQVRKADLDTNTLAAYYFAWMEVYLEKKNFDKVAHKVIDDISLEEYNSFKAILDKIERNVNKLC